MSKARESQFPYRLANLTDLAAGFLQAAKAGLPAGEDPLSIVMIPPGTFVNVKSNGAWHAPRQVTIFTPKGILHIQEENGKYPATYLNGADLVYVHHTLILLYGRLELAGTSNGDLTRIVIEYNTVGLPILQPDIVRLLSLAYRQDVPSTADDSLTETLLDEIEAKSLKFANGLRLYGLLPGERLLGYVFQARITRRVLRWIRVPVAPAALLALTEQAVIAIAEKHAKGASYGWLISNIPRRRIALMDSAPAHNYRQIRFYVNGDEAKAIQQVTLNEDIARAWQNLWQANCQPAYAKH